MPSRTLVLALMLIVVPLVVPTLRAEILFIYDLDSLNHLSAEVAEARIVRRVPNPSVSLIEVRIETVHKGSFTKGDLVVVAHTGDYAIPAKPRGTRSLAVGDHLVLFLSLARRHGYVKFPENVTIYQPVSGGVKLIEHDKVFGFSQRRNPGPYEADSLSDPEGKHAPSLPQYREQIADSLRFLERAAPLLEAKKDSLDVPALLKLIAGRPEAWMSRRDHIAELACARLAQTQDPAVLHQALPLVKSHPGAAILHKGFGTPKGRDDLLAKIGDSKEPIEVRLRLVSALVNAGPVYRSTLADLVAYGHRTLGEPDAGNSGYLTRIAEAARSQSEHEELCRRLLGCIEYFGRGIAQSKSPPLMLDLQEALAVLRKFYEARPAQRLQYAIESATANADPDAYGRLNSPCGPVISLLIEADAVKHSSPEERKLTFQSSHMAVRLNKDAKLRPSVVLLHQASEKRFVLPSKSIIRRGSTGGGGFESVVLPKDLPHGRYHVFYEFKEGDKVISSGHHVAIDL